MSDDTKDPTDEDKANLHRIERAFGEMPYGGDAGFVRHPITGEVAYLSLDEIATNLERLRNALQRVVTSNQRDRRKLQEFKDRFRDVATIHDFVDRVLAFDSPESGESTDEQDD